MLSAIQNVIRAINNDVLWPVLQWSKHHIRGNIYKKFVILDGGVQKVSSHDGHLAELIQTEWKWSKTKLVKNVILLRNTRSTEENLKEREIAEDDFGVFWSPLKFRVEYYLQSLYSIINSKNKKILILQIIWTKNI